ncbi:MAG: hypothetical protein ACXIT9_12510 [Nitritalea sp.]
MLAKLLIVINLLVSFQLFGQGYKTVEIEKNQIDANNTIYRPGLQFIFNVEITQDHQPAFLKLNKDRTYELLREETESTVSTILMTIAKPKDKDKTNKKQTEIFYSYPNTKFLASATGLVENDENIWIHPPRDSFFSITS